MEKRPMPSDFSAEFAIPSKTGSYPAAENVSHKGDGLATRYSTLTTPFRRAFGTKELWHKVGLVTPVPTTFQVLVSHGTLFVICSGSPMQPFADPIRRRRHWDPLLQFKIDPLPLTWYCRIVSCCVPDIS
jgi:hypothetical protein